MVTTNKPLVLLFSTFYPPFQSGAERFAVEAVARLSPRFRFVVVTARLQRQSTAREVVGEVEIRRLGLGLPVDKWLFPLLAPVVAWRVRPTLLHAVMESYAGIALWLTSFLLPRTPRILTLQSGDLDSSKKQQRIPAWLWRRIHTSPDHITAISRFLAERATRLRGSQRDVSVVPNGVDRTVIPRAVASVPGRIVCVARLSWEKGLNDLIDAVALVRRRMPEAHLVLVGDGADRAALEARVAERGLTDAVAFRGALPNAEALKEVAEAAVFACPSLAEGLGIVFLEAQAVGVPVVGTRVGGIPDVIADGVTGLLVPPQDPQALSVALLRMLQDRTFAQQTVVAAQAQLPRFDWQHIMDGVAERYDRLLKEKRLLIATGIFPPAIGGPATFVTTIVPHLQRAGWQINVLTYGSNQTVRPESYAVHVVPNNSPAGVRHVVYAWRAWRLLRRVDGVFLQDPVSAGVPTTVANLFVRRRMVLKVVGDHAWEQGQARFHVQDRLDDFQGRQYSMVVESLRKAEHWVARRAERVVVPSTYLQKIVGMWGVPEARVMVVYNAVRIPAAPAYAAPLSERPMHMVTSGRLVPWKGMRELIAALPIIRAACPETRLTIIGDGPERAALEAGVAQLGLSEVVTFTGQLSHAETAERVAAARVFVLNSSYEGFSHQLVEAMALGAPVVCTDAGGNTEVARHEMNALMVPVGDQSALVEAILRAVRDWPFATRLVAQAQLDARAFTEERMVAGVQAVLQETLG